MKLVFAGTPVFAARALEALLNSSEHTVELVLTQPDRPAGRGKKVQMSPVKQVALSHGIAVDQPLKLKDPATWHGLEAIKPDALIVAAYGLILPIGLLELPRFGGLNIHASLLPRWRGAAPIHRAIEAGDTASGVGIMQMEAGLDTGPVWLTRHCPIGPEMTGGQLHDELAELGAQALLEALPLIEAGAQQPEPQSEHGITYAAKITSAERELDFGLPAAQLHNKIRAFDPAPGTTARLADSADTYKIWRARPLADAGNASPGTVLSADRDEVIVQCGQGSRLSLLDIQRPGAQRMSISRFQQGAALQAGQCFALPHTS